MEVQYLDLQLFLDSLVFIKQREFKIILKMTIPNQVDIYRSNYK